MKSEQTISLAMIVKNEEFNLSKCLHNIKELVDEILVVDTGSTDRTIEIARQFGASVYSYDWNDDFSDARNFSLKKCKGKWIFVLDADELLDESDKGKIRKLVEEKDFVAFAFDQLTYFNMDNCPDLRIMKVLRLFPNDSSLRYSGKVRENIISGDSKKELKVKSSNIKIWHYGLIDVNYPVRKKYERDLKIYHKILELCPKDPVENFFAGLTCFLLNKYDMALTYLNRALKYASPETMYSSAFYSTIAGVYIRQNRYREAIEKCREGLSKNHINPDLYFNLGECYLNLKDYDKAIYNYGKAIELNGNSYFFQDPSRSSWRAWTQTGLAFSRNKEYEKGKEAFLKALSIKPGFPPLLKSLAYIFSELEDINNAEKYFYAAYEQEFYRPELAYELYEIYMKTGRPLQGAKVLENIYNLSKDKKTILRDIAIAFEKGGEISRAIEYYNMYIESEPEDVMAPLRRGICFFKIGSTRKAKKVFDKYKKERPELLKEVFLEDLV